MIANIVAYGLSYTQRVNRDGNAMAYGQSKLNALFRAINTCTSVTEALADVIIIDQGEVVDFDTLAEAVYEKNDFLRSIQLAPDGVITYVYPEQGNEAGKINLFTDPDRKAEAYQAKRSGQTNVAGPFNLKQGGFGFAVRQPVYLKKGDTSTFWGFSIVICDMEDVLRQAAFDSIDKLGYSYRLTATVNNEEVFVSGLKEKTGGGEGGADHLRKAVASHAVPQGLFDRPAVLLGLFGDDVHDRPPRFRPGQPEPGPDRPQ